MRALTKRQFSGDQERELETLWRMTNRPTVDDDFSSFSDFFFSIVQNRMKKRILEKWLNHTVGVNCRHTTHRTKRGTKGQTSQVIDMQLCRLSITWYRIGCRKTTLVFRSFISRFAALDFTDFGWIPMFTIGRKVEMGSFSSYELFIIPRLNGIIHNSRFSNSKYSLFIFF